MNDRLDIPSLDYCTLDSECPYLPDRMCRMYYRYIPDITKELASALIKRGWRRFGHSYFRPICAECTKCKSLRIDVRNFRPSKSQRRVMKKNRDTDFFIQRPSITREHVELFNKYHLFKSEKSGWTYSQMQPWSYHTEFVEGAHDFGHEVLYIKDNKLVGVDLIDILDDGISSIYFFYDPDYQRLSLGIYSLLIQIELAKALGLDWIYLGYWVDGCASFAYKTAFKPFQLLDGFPPLHEKPRWRGVLTDSNGNIVDLSFPAAFKEPELYVPRSPKESHYLARLGILDNEPE